ncbi:MAG: trypsin-like peptidase domain-containing protein [Burkholderiales bacterium]|jgi:S1-C subfamily serine protease|nr:trypsin-like peptidase domain-containing protein [Burkholderiales bacterium]
MKRVALYSQSAPAAAPPPRLADRPVEAAQAAPAATAPAAAWRRLAARYDRPLLLLAGALLMGLAVLALQRSGPASRVLKQADIDKAVLHTLGSKVLPSPAAKAAQAVAPAVVRVRGVAPGERGDADLDEGVGSGVVIVDTGVILTNLHVVSGAEKVVVEFHDGHESDAVVISVKPEHDLAVLQAKSLPDDLLPATLRSTSDLQPGDQVVAVGFPFGIGPSVSAGVISGLAREFRSPEGKRTLTNLIQFDAAANPGNSGGPLVTMDGEVVGIVTAILNPGRERTFIGIGFAVPIENAAAGAGMHPF